MTTPEQALKAARAYVHASRTSVTVAKLVEDDRDYFAHLKLVPPATEWIVGHGFVFVNKASGKVWESPVDLDILDKIDGMRELP